jgi:hypothetical protein
MSYNQTLVYTDHFCAIYSLNNTEVAVYGHRAYGMTTNKIKRIVSYDFGLLKVKDT